MSRENVEIIRRAIEAYEREGLDGSLRYYDPEIEWTSTDANIEAATYRGHDGVGRYLGTMEAEFDDLRIEPVELIDADEQVVSCVRISGRGKASGAPVELTLFSVGSVRDGRISEVIESTTARGIYELRDEFDFSTDASVARGRPG